MTSLPIIQSCNNCGACCMEQESPPGYLSILVYGEDGANSQADLDRFNAMPQRLRKELEEYHSDMVAGLDHPKSGVCIWFNEHTRQCKHYDLRPDVCREEIQVGDDACRGWRDVYYCHGAVWK